MNRSQSSTVVITLRIRMYWVMSVAPLNEIIMARIIWKSGGVQLMFASEIWPEFKKICAFSKCTAGSLPR